MGWLTGIEVSRNVELGNIKIKPFNENQVNPNSYDYRLAPTLRRLKFNDEFRGIPCINPRKPMQYEEIEIPETGFLMEVEQAYLGYTVEKFGSNCFASLVTGKSSIGRLFVKNHACAGLIDQGFYGNITLEMTAKLPTIVYPYMRFGQIFWFESIGNINLYDGKYNANNAGVPSKIYMDLDK